MSTASAQNGKIRVRVVGDKLCSERGIEGYVKEANGKMAAFYPDGRFIKYLEPEKTVCSAPTALPVALPVMPVLPAKKNSPSSKRLIIGGISAIVALLLTLTIYIFANSGNRQKKIADSNGNVPIANIKVNDGKFQVSHKFTNAEVNYGEGYGSTYINLTIKGSVTNERMAALLTFPDGKTEERRITLTESISPTYNPVRFPIDNNENLGPLPGTYTFVIKTKDKIIYQEEMTFSGGKLNVKDVEFVLSPLSYNPNVSPIDERNKECMGLDKVKILVTKEEGDIPVVFRGLSLGINKNAPDNHSRRRTIVTENEFWIHLNTTEITFSHDEIYVVFEKGKRYILKGRLYFGSIDPSSMELAKGRYIEFEKEIIR